MVCFLFKIPLIVVLCLFFIYTFLKGGFDEGPITCNVTLKYTFQQFKFCLGFAYYSPQVAKLLRLLSTQDTPLTITKQMSLKPLPAVPQFLFLFV